MKQPIPFLILFTLTLLLFTPNLAAALFTQEAAEIPYQINSSDRIVIGTVSEINVADYYTNNTITIKEWLYNPLPTKTIIVRTNMGSNVWVEDEAEFTKNESVLLMLKDQRPDKGVFYMSLGFLGKHPASDRDSVIEALKTQGKWQSENQIGNVINKTGIKDDISGNSSNISDNVDSLPQRLPLTFGPETLDELKSNPDFIAAYGSIPAFATSEERKQWLDKLETVYHMSISEMSKYMYPNGPVTAFGYTIDGILQVGVNETVEKSFTYEIYKIFDSKASLIGIKEVPVVFVHQDLAVPTTLIEPVVKKTNLSASEDKNSIELNNNSSGNKSSTINSSPGFELLGSLTCLYSGWRLRKK